MENTKTWFIALILTVFTAGILAGILMDKKFFTAAPPPPEAMDARDVRRMDGPPPGGFKREPGADRHRLDFVHILTATLDLSEDQQKQIDAILKKNEPAMLTLRDDMDKRMKKLHGKVTSEISKVLTSEQKRKFEEMNEQMKKRIEQRQARPFPGGGPGMHEPGPPPEPMMGNDPHE